MPLRIGGAVVRWLYVRMYAARYPTEVEGIAWSIVPTGQVDPPPAEGGGDTPKPPTWQVGGHDLPDAARKFIA
jgi:hypothetical protein